MIESRRLNGSGENIEPLRGETMMRGPSNGEFKEVIQLGDERVPAYFRRKAVVIRIVGAVMLIAASPIILLLVVFVRLSSAGPGLYRQERTGKNGVGFRMYKLRTMYQDAETVSGPVWCQPSDSRITPLGKVLRLLHLDELPQLINVVRGEMDLIGPRPERPEFVVKLTREVPDYEARLQILPGVTGLAQINLPPDTNTESVRKKLVLDCAYIREAGFLLDARILVCTFFRMIGIRHGLAAKWLGVRRVVTLTAQKKAACDAEPSMWSHPHSRPVAAAVKNLNGVCLTLVTPGVESGNEHYNIDSDATNSHTAHSLRRPR